MTSRMATLMCSVLERGLVLCVTTTVFRVYQVESRGRKSPLSVKFLGVFDWLGRHSIPTLHWQRRDACEIMPSSRWATLLLENGRIAWYRFPVIAVAKTLVRLAGITDRPFLPR
jgi:hypothetical protein